MGKTTPAKGKLPLASDKKQNVSAKQLARRPTAGVPATKDDISNMMAKDTGDGMQGMRAEDLAIPFLLILQSGSPQLKKNNEKFIPGAKEGQIFNTVTGDLYSEVTVIPVSFIKQFIEWKPRKTGGGFVTAHDRMAPVVNNTKPNAEGRCILSNGNELVETAQYYVLLYDAEAGTVERAVISMSSTQLKKSRRWNTMIQEIKVQGVAGPFTPPMYAHSYNLSTRDESNDKGNWVGWVIEPGNLLNVQEIYQLARMFSKAVMAQEVTVDQAKAEETGYVDVEATGKGAKRDY